MLWHHMLTRDVLEACSTSVRHGWEVDAMLDANGGATARLHLAEVLSRAAAPHGVVLPPTDGALLASLRFHPLPASTWSGGTLTTTRGGLLGYILGDGRAVESTGQSLTIITHPGGRYTRGYRHPNISHH